MQSAYQVINEDVMARTIRGVVNFTRAQQDASAAFESWPTIHNPGHKLTPAQRATKRARGKASRQARATHRRK